jgi:hypothetical protein
VRQLAADRRVGAEAGHDESVGRQLEQLAIDLH